VVSLGQATSYRKFQYRYGAGDPLLLALLMDLDPTISAGGVFARQEPANAPVQPGRERLIITWERLRGFRRPTAEFTFQAILYTDGAFDFVYNDLPEQLWFEPNDDPGASLWAVGVAPGSAPGPQLVTLTDLPLSTGPDGVLQDYHLEFRQHLHQLFAPLAGLILIASVLIVIGFPLLFRFTLVNPLNALLRGVRRIEAGDYSSRVPVQYPDEIGFLTRAFNALAAQLGDLIRNLEARVAARTQALNAANTHLRAEIAEREQAQATLIEQQRALAAFEERERLGRDLHDGLGQVMGYINVQAQTVKTMLAAGQTLPAQANLQRITQAAQEAHADIRDFILGLRADDAPRQNFWEALRDYLRQFQTTYGIETRLSLPDGAPLRDYLRQFQTTYGIETRLSLPDGAPLPEFGPVVEEQLLRIIQEALTNVRKHAAARQVEVLFSFTAAATHVRGG
jgi:nitrate/nitrite-specific signal transduction histidine kinase